MLEKINSCYLRVLKYFGIFLGILAPLMEVYQVLLRFVIKQSMGNVDELLQFVIIWLYIVGAIYSAYKRNHIECGILNVYIKKEITMARLGVVKAVISLIVGVWLCYWGLWYLIYSIQRWKLSELLRIPWVFANSALSIGFILVTMYCAIDVVLSIKRLKNTDKEAPRHDV